MTRKGFKQTPEAIERWRISIRKFYERGGSIPHPRPRYYPFKYNPSFVIDIEL